MHKNFLCSILFRVFFLLPLLNCSTKPTRNISASLKCSIEEKSNTTVLLTKLFPHIDLQRSLLLHDKGIISKLKYISKQVIKNKDKAISPCQNLMQTYNGIINSYDMKIKVCNDKLKDFMKGVPKNKSVAIATHLVENSHLDICEYIQFLTTNLLSCKSIAETEVYNQILFWLNSQKLINEVLAPYELNKVYHNLAFFRSSYHKLKLFDQFPNSVRKSHGSIIPKKVVKRSGEYFLRNYLWQLWTNLSLRTNNYIKGTWGIIFGDFEGQIEAAFQSNIEKTTVRYGNNYFSFSYNSYTITNLKTCQSTMIRRVLMLSECPECSNLSDMRNVLDYCPNPSCIPACNNCQQAKVVKHSKVMDLCLYCGTRFDKNPCRQTIFKTM